MAEIVLELKRRNWTDKKIAKNLGMDQDEILRLCQITGLREMFDDQDFTLAWDLKDEPEKLGLDELDVGEAILSPLSSWDFLMIVIGK